MKRFLILLSLLFCSTSFAATETINWYVDGNSYATTTCQTGGDIILPNTPTKYGYTFQGWANYIPIEYLESTGTQYIDTGYIPNNNTRVIAEIKSGSTTNLGNWIFGTRINASSNEKFGFAIFTNPGNTQQIKTYRTDYGSETTNKEASINLSNIKIEVDFDKNTSKICNNSTNIGEITSTVQTFTSANNLWLFMLNTNGSPLSFGSAIKIYFCKLYDNNVLVRDFIPVLDANGTPCMYDKVTKQYFYNQGTGSFIAGPVINQ